MASEIRVNLKFSKVDVPLSEWQANIKPRILNLILQLRAAMFTVDVEGGFFERDPVE